MKVTVTSRNYNINDPFRTYIEERLDKLDRFFNRLLEAQVTLNVEKYRHSAEVKILANGTTLNGKDIAGDMRTAVDNAVDKLEKQVKKYKEKLKERKFKEETEFTSFIESGDLSDDEEPGLSVLDGIDIKVQAVESMWLEEAVSLFRKENKTFFMFKNHDTERINLLYRKDDGDIGVLDAYVSG